MKTKEKSEKSELSPYHAKEYEAFIKMLESGVPVVSWKGCAESFGVTDDTLIEWRKTERARKATQKAINETLNNMKKAGITDWRMWDRYYRLLGVDAPEQTRTELTGKDGKDLEALVIIKDK